jgi:hypothetical protein
MKIHDYGIWFRDIPTKGLGHVSLAWRKSPIDTSEIYFNGIYLGLWHANYAWVAVDFLVKAKVKLKRSVHCNFNWEGEWDFPPGYIPIDDDFESVE